MGETRIRDRYDVAIAGARCAGASIAMLLARRGYRVLVVDPSRPGSDTLSTHALMRGGVLQLHRWGLLDRIREAGTPPVRTTTFHYGDDAVEVPIKPGDGVDALYAPRRTLLDAVLAEGARAAGAQVVHGLAVDDLLRGRNGRVRGFVAAGPDGVRHEVEADLVVGADGVRSRVARLLQAPVDYRASHAAATVYGYWPGLGVRGYHWYFGSGVSAGAIPTNEGDTCVFVAMPPERFHRERSRGLEGLHRSVLAEMAPELARELAGTRGSSKLRAFPGEPGLLRRSVGPGWALVGDAGYFRDPITAHGITDALRDAELLADAVSRGGDDALAAYQEQRDALVRGLLDVTDRIASFEWDLEEVRELHLDLSREMKKEVKLLAELERPGPALSPPGPSAPAAPAGATPGRRSSPA